MVNDISESISAPATLGFENGGVIDMFAGLAITKPVAGTGDTVALIKGYRVSSCGTKERLGPVEVTGAGTSEYSTEL